MLWGGGGLGVDFDTRSLLAFFSFSCLLVVTEGGKVVMSRDRDLGHDIMSVYNSL